MVNKLTTISDLLLRARRNQATLDYTNANKAWWNMAEMYLYRVRHDEAWAKEQLGI